jgi:DNA polymerase
VATTLAELAADAAGCTRCDLYRHATQTVFGEGPAGADLVLVGEQPGDKEDLAGEPFVGPAGRLLDDALAQAGIDRSRAYVTNVVKHFKWEPRGKQRIHKKPNAAEQAACRPWVEAELDLLKPEVLVCLGATAAQSLLGKGFKVTERRGEWVDSPLAPHVLATVHPSSILRGDPDSRRSALDAFVADLTVAASALRPRR